MPDITRDLDRAYVINGSDLNYALSGMNGRPPLVPNPRDVAEYILDTIAQSQDKAGYRVTREQLVGVLQEFHLWVTPERDQDPWATGVRGTPQNPEALADGLLLALRANAAHREPEEPPPCPWCRGAPFVRTADCTCVISCGNDHCCPDGTVVDAHICCEHADDPELSAMADIVRLMEAGTPDGHAVIRAMYPLDGPALVRVLRWLLARFPADPPF